MFLKKEAIEKIVNHYDNNDELLEVVKKQAKAFSQNLTTLFRKEEDIFGYYEAEYEFVDDMARMVLIRNVLEMYASLDSLLLCLEISEADLKKVSDLFQLDVL